MKTIPGSSDREFVQLLERARRGDQYALGQLINRYRTYLLRIACDQGDSQMQAKDGDSDFVQEACLKAITAFSHFKGATAKEMRSWLRAILLHQINDARKQALTRKRDIRAEIPLHDLEAGDSRNDNLAVLEPSPASAIVHQEERTLLEKALGELPEMDRGIFEMRQKDGLAFVEIARQLQMSEEAAQKRWVRALKLLQQKVHRPT